MKEANDLTSLWANAVGIYTDRDPFTIMESYKSPLTYAFDGIQTQVDRVIKPSAYVTLIVNSAEMPASYLTGDQWFFHCNKSALGDDLWEVGMIFDKLKDVKGEHQKAAQAIINEVKLRSSQKKPDILMPVKHAEIPTVTSSEDVETTPVQKALAAGFPPEIKL